MDAFLLPFWRVRNPQRGRRSIGRRQRRLGGADALARDPDIPQGLAAASLRVNAGAISYNASKAAVNSLAQTAAARAR